MKKLVSLTLALLMALLTLLPAMAENVHPVRTGVLSMLNVTEAEMVNYKKARHLITIQLEKEGLLTHKFRQIHEEAGNDDMLDPNFEIVYFDTLDAALMALNVGDINTLEVYETVAQYLTHSDPGLIQVKTFSEDVDENAFARYVREGLLSNDFAFMFMEDNEALRDEFNAALASRAVDAVFWTRTSSKSNEIGNLSEEERARLQEADSQEQSEEERETIRQARELISFADYGRADMPEGTIITEPYFSDIIVSVTTQAKLDEEAALANQ